jgi:hypothetical protein
MRAQSCALPDVSALEEIKFPMRRTVLPVTVSLVFILSLACAALLAAQSTIGVRSPGPDVKKLDYFAGSWKSEGDMKSGPYTSGGKFSGTGRSEWMPGGFFLLSYTDEMSPLGKGTGLAIYGYDRKERVYTYQAYNSRGEAEHAKGVVEGDTWTWSNEEKIGGTVMRGRYIIKTISPTAYNFKFEMAPEGGQWSTIIEGKATKTK